jgi:hypothetical protein
MAARRRAGGLDAPGIGHHIDICRIAGPVEMNSLLGAGPAPAKRQHHDRGDRNDTGPDGSGPDNPGPKSAQGFPLTGKPIIGLVSGRLMFGR